MSDTALEGVLRRDRYVIFAALSILTALAWIYLFWLAAQMAMPAADPAMRGMDMAAIAPAPRPWTVMDFLFSFIMWAVMMAGMMIPSAAPTILLYARVGRQAVAQHKPFAATGWFAGGYLLAWAIFSFLAAFLQAGLSHAALLTPMMTSASNLMGGGILIVAGLYQWSGWKNACLSNCRAPLAFIQQHGGFKRRALPSLGLGSRHGLVCIGCCWALMLLLFAGGIMNIAWIAGLAILVLFEKLLTDGRNVSRVIGLALIIAGLLLVNQKPA
jgi:predicted metal-binding membrane protein